MEQLIKQACDLYDWVALLWAAFGEFLARNGSPPSIIGGHSFYFRLQDPVLDKSDNFLERNRWVGGVRQVHVIDGSGHSQRHIDSLRLCFEAKIQNWVDAYRIVKANRPFVYRISRIQEDQLSLADLDSPRDARLRSRTQNVQVGIYL